MAEPAANLVSLNITIVQAEYCELYLVALCLYNSHTQLENLCPFMKRHVTIVARGYTNQLNLAIIITSSISCNLVQRDPSTVLM